MGRFSVFLKTILQLSSKICWALKRRDIVNPAIFVVFSFLQLCNIKGTYSKYFQNKISETDISSSVINYLLIFCKNFIYIQRM